MRYACLAFILPSAAHAQTPLDCAEWRFAESVPAGLTRGNLVYDSVRGELLCLGAALDASEDAPWDPRMFRWTGQSWDPIDTPHPAFTRNDKVAFDEARGIVVVLRRMALWDIQTETWEWDGQTWTVHDPVGGSIPVAFSSAMTYDPTRGRTVLFEQPGPPFTNVLRRWDGHAWTAEPVPGPPVGWNLTIVPDISRGTLLFVVPSGSHAEIWEYDGQSCTYRTTAPTLGFSSSAPIAAPLPDGSSILIPSNFDSASFFQYQDGVARWSSPMTCTGSDDGPLTHLFTDRVRGTMIAVKQPYNGSMLPGVIEFGPPRVRLDTLATYTAGQQELSFWACGGNVLTRWFRNGDELSEYQYSLNIPVEVSRFLPDRYWCVISNPCGDVRSAVAVVQSTHCLADFDQDNFVDMFDYIAFTEDAPRYADINGDGERDPGDLAAFIQLFERGCN